MLNCYEYIADFTYYITPYFLKYLYKERPIYTMKQLSFGTKFMFKDILYSLCYYLNNKFDEACCWNIFLILLNKMV